MLEAIALSKNDQRYKQNNTKLCEALVSTSKEYADYDVGTGLFPPLRTSGVKDPPKTVNGMFMTTAIENDPLFSNIPGFQSQNSKVLIGKKISGYDRAVMDAVYTLWLRRKDKTVDECSLSYIEIYRTMIGDPKKEVHIDTQRKIARSITKLRNIDSLLIFDDDMDRVKQYFPAKADSIYVREHLISAMQIGIKLKNGSATGGIKLYACPILHRYAEAQTQILTVPMTWISLPGKISEKKIAIRDYLVRHIKALSSKKTKIKITKIKYETIIEGAGIPWSDDRRIQCKDRHLVNEILDYYVNAKIIQKYEKVDSKTIEIVI